MSSSGAVQEPIAALLAAIVLRLAGCAAPSGTVASPPPSGMTSPSPATDAGRGAPAGSTPSAAPAAPAPSSRGADAPGRDADVAQTEDALARGPSDAIAVTSDAIPDAEVRRAVQATSGRARACYQRALSRGAGGRVVVRIEVDRTGRVASARVASSTLGDPTVEQCLVRVAMTWVFTPPVGGSAIVEVPYTFAGASPSP